MFINTTTSTITSGQLIYSGTGTTDGTLVSGGTGTGTAPATTTTTLPAGWQASVPLEPSEEMIRIAEKILADPDFDVGKFLIRLLAKHLEDYYLSCTTDEVIKKYLPPR